MMFRKAKGLSFESKQMQGGTCKYYCHLRPVLDTGHMGTEPCDPATFVILLSLGKRIDMAVPLLFAQGENSGSGASENLGCGLRSKWCFSFSVEF